MGYSMCLLNIILESKEHQQLIHFYLVDLSSRSAKSLKDLSDLGQSHLSCFMLILALILDKAIPLVITLNPEWIPNRLDFFLHLIGYW